MPIVAHESEDVILNGLKPTYKIVSKLLSVEHRLSHPLPDQSLLHFFLTSNPKLILHFVLSDLKAEHEPLLSDMAARLSLSESDLAKSLSPLGIKAQDTTRGQYFTKSMIPQIEKIVGANR